MTVTQTSLLSTQALMYRQQGYLGKCVLPLDEHKSCIFRAEVAGGTLHFSLLLC